MSAKPIKVSPIEAQGMNMSVFGGLFGLGPKWTITCGNCVVTFKKRIPIVNTPGIECPTCSAINVLDLVVT